MRQNRVLRLLLALLLTSCTKSGGSSPSSSSSSVPEPGTSSSEAATKEHVRNSEDLGGSELLDDGGDIQFTDPQLVATGVETKGEKTVKLGEDEGKYELFNGAVLAEWKNSDHTFSRVRCGIDEEKKEKGVIFAFDFSSAADLSKVGCQVTLIYTRRYTRIAVSTDKENWTDIGYGKDSGIFCDYAVHLDTLLGNSVSDANLYQCYYALGKYAQKNHPLYLLCGYSEAYPNALASPAGTDVIGYVSQFDEMVIKEEYR